MACPPAPAWSPGSGTRTKTGAASAAPAAATGTVRPAFAASTSPFTIIHRATGSSRTGSVAMASRSAAFSVRTTRLRGDPGISSNLAGSSASAARPPMPPDDATPAMTSAAAETIHRS